MKDDLYIRSVNSLQVAWQKGWGFLCGRRQESSRYAQGGRAVNIELLGDGEADKLAALMWIELHWGFQNWVTWVCGAHGINNEKEKEARYQVTCFEIRYKLLAGRCRTYSENKCRGEDSWMREVKREERRRDTVQEVRRRTVTSAFLLHFKMWC